MRKILTAWLLLTALIASASAADKPIDVEEYASIEALASAIASHVPGVTGKKIKLAVIPVKTSRSDMVPELVRRLAASGRFDVLEAEKVAAFLKDKQQGGPALVNDMARAFDLDEVIAIRAYPSDGKLLIIARIFHTAGPNPPATFVALLNSGPKAVAAGGEAGPVVVAAGDKGVNAPDLPLAARYVALADLDGDGKTEYVFSDGERLHIYRLESSTWRKVWGQSPAEAGDGKHLYLDAADVNGNGRPEIFVTLLRNRKALSVVYEERNGAYRPIAELPVFLRILHYPGRGPVLIGQDFDEKRFFGKAAKQYFWSGDNYAAVGDFPLPKDVNLYGFVVAEFGEAHPLIVALSEKNRLRVYSRETLVWESQERYGGTETAAVESSADIYSVEQKVSIKGRMFAVDIDGDGKDEIIIPRNMGATVFTAAKESEVYAMEWTGARLEQKAAIRQAPGAVLDLQMVRQTGGGARIAALVATKGGAFSKPGSRLITYSIR